MVWSELSVHLMARCSSLALDCSAAGICRPVTQKLVGHSVAREGGSLSMSVLNGGLLGLVRLQLPLMQSMHALMTTKVEQHLSPA